MRAGEIVEIKLARDVGGQVVAARTLAPDEWPHGYTCLAIINKRLRFDECSEKDGLKVGPRKLNLKDILGVVLLIDGKSPYEGEDPTGGGYPYLENRRQQIAAGTRAIEAGTSTGASRSDSSFAGGVA
jgi:hypothetical protein